MEPKAILKAAGLLALPFAGTAGLWLMDNAMVAMVNKETSICNGFFCVAPDRLFHTVLYLALASMWLLAAWTLAGWWVKR